MWYPVCVHGLYVCLCAGYLLEVIDGFKPNFVEWQILGQGPID